MSRIILVAGAFGLLASMAIVALTRNWARRRRVIDHPNDRSLHEQPTPRGGGVGIVLPAVAVLATAPLWMPPHASTPALWLAVLSLGVAVVGIVDDVRSLSAAVRLVFQLLLAVVFVYAVAGWMTLEWPGLGRFDLGALAIPVTVLFVVWLTNAYNFMDGIDGIAGLQGVVAGIGWVGAGHYLGDPLLMGAGAVVAGACLGFLVFNWSPASIFMGDVGAPFLGFLFAGLTAYTSTRSAPAATAGLLFVWPFLFDSIVTLIRRAVKGENLLRAHRSHLYQRLVLNGASHRNMSLLYGALAGIGVAAGWTLMAGSARAQALVAPVIGALAVMLYVFVVVRDRRRR
ncbi:MAG TPA: glycosyltransferase family 4 protein [Vicinamibacterales bacterium]|nr:glycosyltransferase family 4 protein [Vicinamibacterales bacterium]